MTHTWTPPPGTTGLIFDCDGTLADTMPAHYKAWTAMLGSYGIPFPEPRFYAMGGMPTASIIRVLAAEAGVVVTDVDAMVREKEQGFLTHLDAVTIIEPVLAVAASVPGQAAHRGRQRRLPRHHHAHARPARHPRLVRRDGDRGGHAAAQAGAGRVPGSGPAARRGREAAAWCSRTPTSAWKRPAGRG